MPFKVIKSLVHLLCPLYWGRHSLQCGSAHDGVHGSLLVDSVSRIVRNSQERELVLVFLRRRHIAQCFILSQATKGTVHLSAHATRQAQVIRSGFTTVAYTSRLSLNKYKYRLSGCSGIKRNLCLHRQLYNTLNPAAMKPKSNWYPNNGYHY